jgi:KDO2-lipid IV(A) lauroyltransferase
LNSFSFDAAGPYLKYYGFRALCYLIHVLPKAVSYALARAVGSLLYRQSKEKKAIVYENMRRIRPDAGPEEWDGLARRCFQNYAVYWVDFLRCYWLSLDDVNTEIVTHGVQWFDRCLEGGKGAVIALPHYGSWDLIGGWVGQRYDFWAVAEVLDPPAMTRFHTELRRRMAIQIIPLAENTVERVIEVLMQNGIVALLSDRVLAGGSVKVEFFGSQVEFPIGPALLAVKLGSPIIPCLTIRKGQYYHGYVGPPLEVEITGDTRHDVREITQKLARVYERYIREDPTQWHMFQPIWREPEP